MNFSNNPKTNKDTFFVVICKAVGLISIIIYFSDMLFPTGLSLNDMSFRKFFTSMSESALDFKLYQVIYLVIFGMLLNFLLACVSTQVVHNAWTLKRIDVKILSVKAIPSSLKKEFAFAYIKITRGIHSFASYLKFALVLAYYTIALTSLLKLPYNERIIRGLIIFNVIVISLNFAGIVRLYNVNIRDLYKLSRLDTSGEIALLGKCVNYGEMSVQANSFQEAMSLMKEDENINALIDEIDKQNNSLSVYLLTADRYLERLEDIPEMKE